MKMLPLHDIEKTYGIHTLVLITVYYFLTII